MLSGTVFDCTVHEPPGKVGLSVMSVVEVEVLLARFVNPRGVRKLV